MSESGNVIFDLDNALLIEHDREIFLSPQETKVLYQLYLNKGNFVKAPEFCKTLWPARPPDSEYWCVANVMRRLKAYLLTTAVRIESQHGHGYRLVGPIEVVKRGEVCPHCNGSGLK